MSVTKLPLRVRRQGVTERWDGTFHPLIQGLHSNF